MKRTTDANTWIQEIPPKDLERQIRDVFDLLCREFSFSAPVVDRSSLTLRLSYRAQRIAVEVSVDFRDLAVEVALVWLRDGRRPEGWAVDAEGRQFMVRIYEAARFRRVPNPRVTIPPDAAPQIMLRLWLQAWLEQLRTQFADVLADTDTLFYELNQAKGHS